MNSGTWVMPKAPPTEHHDYIGLDRSGSMAGATWVFALEGTNAYVRKLAKEKVVSPVTLASFNNESVDIKRSVKSPRDWYAVMSSERDFQPEGGTPLNAAIVALISLAERDEVGSATFLFVTDGHDTTSYEMTERAIAAIARARKRGWTVLFMGAGFDPGEMAQRYGVEEEHFIRVKPVLLAKAMTETAEARAQNIASGKAIGFTPEQKLLLGGPK